MTSLTSPQTGGSAQDLIFSTLIRHLEKVFPREERMIWQMLTWPPRPRALGHGEAGLTQVWGVSGRMADLTQVRSTPLTYRRTPHHKDSGYDCMPTSRTGPQGSTPPTELQLRTETTVGELTHTGLNQKCLLNRHEGGTHLLGKHQISPRGACRAPAPIESGEVPSRTPPLSTSRSKPSSSSSALSIWPSSLCRGLDAPGRIFAGCNTPRRPYGLSS
ncbi:hypothetical protein BHM03_00023650 [Ensete ventricosum]|nr:hypothetical protein BHM03_00023650 [Ensete ventricosum]